ncbi:hypothetical protein T09_12379, partial [Trichinella sp. T9]
LLATHLQHGFLSAWFVHACRSTAMQALLCYLFMHLSNNFGEENFFTKFQFQPNPARSVDVCKNFVCSK